MTQNQKFLLKKWAYFLPKINFWPLFWGPKCPGSEPSEPQKGVKKWLFDNSESTFSTKKNYLEKVLLKKLFHKTIF